MTSGLASLFPGVDLCALPAGVSPEGTFGNFDHTPSLLKKVIISLTIIFTLLAVIFAFGRLWAKLAKWTWSDLLVLLATMAAVTQGVLMIVFVKYYRHIWDVRLCWINAQFMQLSYTYEMMTSFGLLFAKTATLLLFLQFFQVSKQLRMAIHAGLLINFLIYASSIGVLSYYSVPHIGHSWDDVVVDQVLHPQIFSFKWGVGQGSLGAALDIYIFILPLPTLARLNLSSRKRVQLMAVFFTAVFGIVASLASLVYRVKALKSSDSTWIAGVLMICNQTELAVGIIIASMPGFAGFMRVHVLESKFSQSVRSLLGTTSGKASQNAKKHPVEPFNINRPRSTFDSRRPGQKAPRPYYDMDETWLMSSRATVDIEHLAHPFQPMYEGKGVSVKQSVVVEEAKR